MAQNTQLQETYSNLVLAKLRKETIFAGLFSKKHVGNATAGAVKVPVRDTEAVAGTYDIESGKTLTVPTTTYKTIVTDTDLAVNELCDGYVAAAVPDGLVAERLDSAGYSLAKAVDDMLVSLILTSGKSTDNASTTALDKDTVYTTIVADIQVAKKAGVKLDTMWLAVTNDTYTKILNAPEFIKASNLGDDVVTNGYVGKIAGVKVYETNNIADTTNVEYILGNNEFCHFVEEWRTPVALDDLKDGAHIGSSAVQGRLVVGAEVSRPTTVIVKKHA